MSPAPILDLIEAFRRSKTLFTAVKLGVFDRLHEAPAAASDFEHPAMDRLLDGCVSLGLLEKRDGKFINTPLAEEYLVRSSPRSFYGYIVYSNDALYPMWGHLDDAIREDSHRWKQTFGTDGPLWDYFFRTAEAKHDFLMGMHGFGQLTSPSIAGAFDLSGYRKLVDLGGATGHLALAVRDRYPQIQAAVFDLPPVIAVVRELVGQRAELIAGDFLSGELPEADLFALGRILHDWNEDKLRRLLKKIFDRLPAGGALLIAEKLMAEDRRGPVAAHMQSLNMLVVTEGRERTLSEYATLLYSAGFETVKGRVTGTPLDAILAVK